MKKVGLLTLPLRENYGGLLQIVALYAAITKAGGDPWLIDKSNPSSSVALWLRRVIEQVPGQDFRGIRSRSQSERLHRPFLLSHMPARTRRVRTGREIEAELSRLGISGVIVGSDQVWRPEYQGDGLEDNYFLDFGPEHLKRYSYAASFGHSRWSYPAKTSRVKHLLGRFDRISVREDSAVDICKSVFGIDDAILALDPTLLHSSDFYKNMIERTSNDCDVLIYVLDQQAEAQRLASSISSDVVTMSPYGDERLTIPQWLSRIASAGLIITDSFHGVVFSIIFKKPFWAIVNEGRGGDRFRSLLGLLGLEHRMIVDSHSMNITSLTEELIYSGAIERLEKQRKISTSFLESLLSDLQ